MRIKSKFLFLYIILSVFIFLSFIQNLSAYQAEVENISSRDYFPKVKEAINKAEKSIYMSMFVISLRLSQPDSGVYKLCDALIEAKKRGVKVKVVLDQNVDYYDEESVVEGKNTLAYQYLTGRGIEVFYDDKYQYTHSKALVIDEKIVVIGSTNWSYSALEKNNESSVLIESPELAKSILDNFLKIELADLSIKRLTDEKKAVAIYKEFFSSENLAGRMITKHDERAFDLYLLLLFNAKKENIIDFNFDEYAKSLAIEEMTATAYRRQIIKSLKKLQDKYKLIKVDFNYADNANVKLLNIKNKNEDYKYPEENYILLPSEYYVYGWNKKLSFRAKYCYLINRYMVNEYKSKYWSMTLKDLSKKFHLIPDTITKGMQELRKLNIIVIEYSTRKEDYVHIQPSVYELLDLYSIEDYEKSLKQLEDKYGKDKVKNAIEFAVVIYCQKDIETIEKIINITEKYGEDKIDKAYKILSAKAVDSPKRTFRYAIGIIEGLID
ncbi:MAG: hypothetical protein JXJ19_05285 [Elusimicrobia bacterium]|nr:hypothetical protein [Elusimicrobiota bacterium]